MVHFLLIMAELFHITAFYKFLPLPAEQIPVLRAQLEQRGEELGMCGLTLVAPEGINGTVAGSESAVTAYKTLLEEIAGEITFKDSTAEFQPFRRWLVKEREEIVGLKNPDIVPGGPHRHLSPQEWHRMLTEEDVLVLDTRNTYETELGVFQGAVDPKLSTFSEFPEWVENSGIPRDKPVLMYCTGGIRCEKALLVMEQQGYENVYQLDGGILNYLQQFPDGHFDGECFVFDHRTAVDKNLQPSQRYKLCPHCGDPGDIHIACPYCEKEAIVCHRCQAKHDPICCSKNCTEQYRRQQEKQRMPLE